MNVSKATRMGMVSKASVLQMWKQLVRIPRAKIKWTRHIKTVSLEFWNRSPKPKGLWNQKVIHLIAEECDFVLTR